MVQMLKRLMGAIALMAALLFATSGDAIARGHGGGGFHGGGFHGGGVAHVGGYRGGVAHYGGVGRGYYGGYGRGYGGWGYGGLYGGWGYGGLYGGYPWLGGGYGYSPYLYDYYPYSYLYPYPNTYYGVDNSIPYIVTPSTPYSIAQAPTSNKPAYVKVEVPNANATVAFDGVKTASKGSVREFQTPPLASGEYTYTVRASWMENGHEKTSSQKVYVEPGAETIVNLLHG